MANHDNALGKPLAESDWLHAHHRAKLPERTAFAARLARLQPRRVVDLGCATGLWLELLNELLPEDCEFIGIDGDDRALKEASERATTWRRETSFIKLDLESETDKIPPADLTLAFNVFSYVQDLPSFLASLAGRIPRGVLAVRQYDGASIRFGPMLTSERQRLESTLRVATEGSDRFRHYDMDRAFEVLHHSPYETSEYEFELFARAAPFPAEFRDYYLGTLHWTRDLLSPATSEALVAWLSVSDDVSDRYFFEVDLVALLS